MSRRSSRRAGYLVMSAGATAFVASVVWAGWVLATTRQSAGDTAAIVALPVALLAALPVFGSLADRRVNLAEAAADLADAVRAREGEERVRLLGNDTIPIDVSYTLAPSAGRNAAGAAAQGKFSDAVEYYQRLHPQRLVITGPAGAGKTVLGIELMLRLLDDREPDDPIPVRVSLPGWNAGTSLTDWLAGLVAGTYGVSRWAARRLAEEGRLLPVLDGLDELDPDPELESAPEPAGGAPSPSAAATARMTTVVAMLNGTVPAASRARWCSPRGPGRGSGSPTRAPAGSGTPPFSAVMIAPLAALDQIEDPAWQSIDTLLIIACFVVIFVFPSVMPALSVLCGGPGPNAARSTGSTGTGRCGGSRPGPRGCSCWSPPHGRRVRRDRDRRRARGAHRPRRRVHPRHDLRAGHDRRAQRRLPGTGPGSVPALDRPERPARGDPVVAADLTGPQAAGWSDIAASVYACLGQYRVQHDPGASGTTFITTVETLAAAATSSAESPGDEYTPESPFDEYKAIFAGKAGGGPPISAATAESQWRSWLRSQA